MKFFFLLRKNARNFKLVKANVLSMSDNFIIRNIQVFKNIICVNDIALLLVPIFKSISLKFNI